MKKIVDGKLYNTEKITKKLEIKTVKRDNDVQFRNPSTSSLTHTFDSTHAMTWTPVDWGTSATWPVSGHVVVTSTNVKPPISYKKYLALTKTKKIIVLQQAFDEENLVDETILGVLDTNEKVLDYIADYYGINPQYDKEIDKLLKSAGIELPEA